jgi:hypothetical protein
VARDTHVTVQDKIDTSTDEEEKDSVTEQSDLNVPKYREMLKEF